MSSSGRTYIPFSVVHVGGIDNDEGEDKVNADDIKTKLHMERVALHNNKECVANNARDVKETAPKKDDVAVTIYKRNGKAYASIDCNKNQYLAIKAIELLHKKDVKGKVMSASFNFDKGYQFSVVHVGGISSGEGEAAVNADDINTMLYSERVNKLHEKECDANRRDGVRIKRKMQRPKKQDVMVTMHKENGKAYALIHCMKNEKLALDVIQLLHKKDIKGKVMTTSFYFAQRDSSLRPYTIGDNSNEYRKFIEELREKLKHKDLVYTHGGRDVKKPALPAQRGDKQPEQWIEIKLCAGNETSTTLVIRNDNLYIEGFQNKDKKWFALRGPDETGKEKLPAEYKAQELGWGTAYSNIMGLKGSDQVQRTVGTARLGKDFAERAVRRLCNYRDMECNDVMPVRLGLAGLSVMICEAARMEPFLRHFEGRANDDNSAWDQGKGLEEKLFVYLWNWSNMSAALRKCILNPLKGWDSGCGVDSAEASDCVSLVLSGQTISPSGGAKVEFLDVHVNFRVREIKLIHEAQERPSSCKIYTEKKADDCKNQQDNKEVSYISRSISMPGFLYAYGLKDEVVLDRYAFANQGAGRARLGAVEQARRAQMRRLDLTVREESISGHKWFSMEVVTPPSTGTSDDTSRKFKFKWDCRNQADGYAATELVTRTIDLLDSGDKVQVKYLIMSKAVKATVEVKLRLQEEKHTLDNEDRAQGNDGGASKKYTADGKIRAHIDGFEQYSPILLFEREEGEGQPFDFKSGLILKLGRSTVHVPKDKWFLQIDINGLRITETCSNSVVDIKEPADSGDKLIFPFGESRSNFRAVNESVSLQVDVGWDLPYEPKRPNAVFSIGDDDLFSNFIDTVRQAFADETKQSFVQPSNGTCRLTRPRPAMGQPEQWIHIKLIVGGLSTTLAVQDGKCYGVGFMNQSKVWYDLGSGNKGCRRNALPAAYRSVLLGWGLSYDGIILDRTADTTDDWDQVYRELNEEGLGKKTFAKNAVRTLSCYPDVDDDFVNKQKKDVDKDGDRMMSPRVALAGLILMVCESARFNYVHNYFHGNWDKDNITETEKFSEEQMKYIWSWGKISQTLLLWEKKGEWTDADPQNPQTPILKTRGIKNKDDALDAVRLVYSDALNLKFRPTTGQDGSESEEAENEVVNE